MLYSVLVFRKKNIIQGNNSTHEKCEAHKHTLSKC